MRRRQELDQRIATVLRLERSINENVELIELGELEGDQGIVADAEAVLQAMRPEVAKQELQTLLSGEADANDCYVEIHAGAGGTESQDWASMLLRMYVRWAEAHRYKVEFIEEHGGEEAGIKSATILVKGNSAYGWLKTESGVHRLVRISPYDANARRHTSFASVWVFPMVDDTIDVEVNESDCRIDTYRASGAGGQHVNTTDSAVRITHLPTGIVVTQAEKSQHQNRARAMQILRARLYDMERSRAAEERSESRRLQVGSGDRSERIRTYNFPQGRVTDHRINLTLYKLDRVMLGELDEVIDALIADHQSRLLADAGAQG
jgi:peptide chain release factor 2